MSGFEVAGIVLGAIPIVVGAMQEYKTVKNIWQKCRIMGIQMDELIEALEEQKVMIQTNIDLLLREIGIDGQLDSTTGSYREMLRSHDIAEELQEYLGKLYDPYRKVLMRCENIIWDIARSIKGLASGLETLPNNLEELVDSTSISSLGKYNYKAKIKFGLRNDDIKRRIQDLKDSREALEKFRVYGSDLHRIEPVKSSSRAIAKFATFLRQVRGHASGLYLAIAQAWSESCHPEHKTKLFLQSRHDLLTSRRRKPIVGFKIVFESSADSPKDGLKYTVDIELMEEEYEFTSSKLPTVRFHDPDNKLVKKPPLGRVDSICKSLEQARKSDQILKVFLCEHRLSKRYEPPAQVVRRQQSNVEHTEHIVSLYELLSTSSIAWNLKNRTTLAFELASSLLQLHSTPWLPAFWNKNSICFLCAKDGSIVFERPFIQGEFHPTTDGYCCPENGSRLDARRPLLELGITLLEVWHRKTFESYTQDKQIKVDDSYGSRMEGAKQWLVETADNMVPTYIDAVERCIECCLATSSSFPDWQDETFQESVCDGIIKPLWENCNYKSR